MIGNLKKVNILLICDKHLGKTMKINHSKRAYATAVRLLAPIKVESSLKEKIANTVLLHDIGYSKKINETNYYEIDGYNFTLKELSKYCFPNSILLQGKSVDNIDSEQIELVKKIKDKISVIEEVTISIIDYCEIRSSERGLTTTILEKADEFKKYSGEESRVYKNFIENIDYYKYIDENINEIIKRLEEYKTKDEAALSSLFKL